MTAKPLIFRRLVCALLMFGWACVAFGVPSEIAGTGASFPAPLYARWASEYLRDTGNQVRYTPTDSGTGTEQAERGSVDFGATDVPLTADDLRRRSLIQFPVVIGGVVPVVNISGIRSGSLRLTGAVLSEIYLGKIVRWNDPAIIALNPELGLPSSRITVVHRVDTSGTTRLWSAYLAGASAEWQARVGVASVLRWPAGVAEVGNEGVASAVQRTRMSIGYVEFAYAIAHGLTYSTLRNRDGNFVQPGKHSFAAAAISASWNDRSDLGQPLIDRPGSESWPIVGASFILLPVRRTPQGRPLEVVDFFDWASRRGAVTADELDYVAMPDEATRLVRGLWADQFGDAVDRSSRTGGTLR